MRIALVLAALALAVMQADAQTSPPPPSPMIIITPDGRDAPARFDGFSDKTTRCVQYGKSIGVPPDQMDDYTKRCTLQ